MITVGQPTAMGFTGPMAAPGTSTTMSWTRQAICTLMNTLMLPMMTKPTPSAPLMLAARRHASDMVRRRYFAHKAGIIRWNSSRNALMATHAW